MAFQKIDSTFVRKKMKAIRNSVHLMGNLGKEVDLRTFSTGMKKASTTLATTEFYKNQKGELVKNTQWHNLIAWGKTAENMGSQLAKGNTIAIHGSIQYRSYEANGQSKQITEILVDEFIRVSKSNPTTGAEEEKSALGEPKKIE